MDGIISEGGLLQFAYNEEQYGYRFWDDSPKEVLMWLKKYLVDDVKKFNDVVIDVEGVKKT